MRIAPIVLGHVLSIVGSATSIAGVGPSFDCSKAKQPLALMLCADSGLSRADLIFNQAYWALYHQVGLSGRDQLKREDTAFSQAVQDRCDIPRVGLPPQGPVAIRCVSNAYDEQRRTWLARLTGPALEEASRPVERHISLKERLEVLGFLTGPGLVAGVYGPATRKAVFDWQSARARLANGFLSDADALALEADTSPNVASSATTSVARNASHRPLVQAQGGIEVALVEGNGVYKVPVLINGMIPLQFVLDSGAADVSITADVFLTLVRTGTIDKDDYVGQAVYRLADGSTAPSDRFIIKELKVGSAVLRNVRASVGGVESPLLLGQSFLGRFSSVFINNDRHVLVLGSERAVAGAAQASSLSSPPVNQGSTSTTLMSNISRPRGRIGVAMQDLTPELAQAAGVLDGAAIARVEPGGSADQAGIKLGDIIIAVNDVSIHSGTELQARILGSEVGRSVYITILRNHGYLRLPVLVERVAEGQ